MRTTLLVVLVATLLADTKAIDCTGLPSENDLQIRLQQLVNSEGGEGDVVITAQDGPFYTCQVQGTVKGTYQQLSVIMTYTVSGSTDLNVRQFEMDCISVGMDTGWESRSDSLQTVDGSVDYTNIAVFTNCSSCTISASNDNHCQACVSECNVGLMRCTGTGSNMCCVAFEDNNMCSADLNCDTNNFEANEQNNFTCACGLSSCTSDGYVFNSATCNCDLADICTADNPCVNDGACTLDTPPDQFSCSCPNSFDENSNCSVCLLTCTDELFPNDNCSFCVDICEVDKPCENGGECMPESKNDYFCDCGNTTFTGDNCTECDVSCITAAGYYLNTELCRCEFNDICETDAPCDNGGTCTPDSAPNNDYQCMCVNQYGSENCTECTLDCSVNGVEDRDCISCKCDDGYTGNDCRTIDYCSSSNNCSGRGNCSNLSDRYECTCEPGYTGTTCDSCSSGYSRRSNSCARTSDSNSFEWWWVVVPVIIVIVLVVIAVILIAIIFCGKKGCRGDDTVL